MSKLFRPTKRSQSGTLDWPYDVATMNEYTVTYETSSIKAYNAIVSIRNDDKVEVSVSVRTNGNVDELVSHSQTLEDGDSMTVRGNLPQPLTIKRKNLCDEAGLETPSRSNLLQFEYATPKDLAYFPFTSADFGYKPFAAKDRTKGRNAGRYCLPTDIMSDDGEEVIGVEFDCW